MHDISDEQNAEHFNKHAPKIVEVLQRAIKDLAPGKGPAINYDSNEPMIQLDQGVVEIHPGVHEQKRIGGYVYRPAFDIITYKVHPAGRWHPEEYEDVPLAITEGQHNTAERAFVEWFRIMAQGWFDADGEHQDYLEAEQLTE